MIVSKNRAGRVILAALTLSLVGFVGCNSDSGGGSAALPPSAGGPPPPVPKEVLGTDGKPTRSTAAFDTARGAKPPK